jgi:hypothetical protein
MEIEIIEQTLIYAVLIPAVITGVLLFIIPQPRALAPYTIGFLAGYYAVQGVPPFPPVESTQWLFWLTIGLFVLAWTPVFALNKGWLRLCVVLGVTIPSLYLLLMPAFQYSWTLPVALGWMSVLAVAVIILYLGLSISDKRTLETGGDRYIAAAVLLAVTATNALILGVSGSVVISQLAAVHASIVGAMFVVMLIRRDEKVFVSQIPFSVLLVSGLVAVGWYFVEVPILCGFLLCTTPWVAKTYPFMIRKGWSKAAGYTVVLLLCLIPLGLALYLALEASPPMDLAY